VVSGGLQAVVMIFSLSSEENFQGLPDLSSSFSPSKPFWAYLFRHLHTVFLLMPNLFAISLVSRTSEARRIIFNRITILCSSVALWVHFFNSALSSSDKVTSRAFRTIFFSF